MILNVLREFYSDEYAMLEYLAAGDLETFKEFASISHYYVNHLIGYGIIDYRNDNFTFRIETIQEYLARKQKYKRINISKADMWREISERRNNLEVKLRLIVRNQLRASFGKAQATNFVLSVLGDPRKSEQSAFSYEKLFDPNSCKIYFEDIRKTIIKHWDCFKNVFNNKDDFDLKMQTINRFRADAHAKDMSLEEFTHFRVSISSIETQVADFLD